MKVSQTGELSLNSTHITDAVAVDFNGPVSIQTVVFCSDNYDGITYSLLVSLNKENWEHFSDKATNIPIIDSLQINYDPFPWKYIRVTTNGTSPTGTVNFLFAY
jgi:hypothetical protein